MLFLLFATVVNSCELNCIGANWSYVDAAGNCTCTDVKLQISQFSYNSPMPYTFDNAPSQYVSYYNITKPLGPERQAVYINPCNSFSYINFANAPQVKNWETPHISNLDVDFVGNSSLLKKFLCLNCTEMQTPCSGIRLETTHLQSVNYNQQVYSGGGSTALQNVIFYPDQLLSTVNSVYVGKLTYSNPFQNGLFAEYSTAYTSGYERSDSYYADGIFLMHHGNNSFYTVANYWGVCYKQTDTTFYTVAVTPESKLPPCENKQSFKFSAYNYPTMPNNRQSGPVLGLLQVGDIEHVHFPDPLHTHHKIVHTHTAVYKQLENGAVEIYHNHLNITHRGTSKSTWSALGLGVAALLMV